MIIATPNLDRLTVAVEAQFLKDAAERPETFSYVPKRPASAAMREYLRRENKRALALIRELFGIVHISHRELTKQVLGRISQEACVSDSLAEELLTLIAWLQSVLRGVTLDQLKTYRDEEIGAVLMELYHVGEQEFDPRNPANELEYNADDVLPTDSETPRDHLVYLIYEVVSTRLIKRSGYELMVAALDA